jgi:hypothetical protein
MSHGRSRSRTFSVALFLAPSLFAGAAAEAQPAACQVVPGLCSAVTSCTSPSFPVCTSTGCTCRIPCNADRECPNGQDCAAGVCAPSPLACSVDSQCTGGQVCGARGTCVPGPAVPACTSNAACDDRDPCNGIETCDGTDCRRGVPPSCNDGNEYTSDRCVVVNGPQGTFRCDNVGPSACSNSAIRQPVLRFASARPGAKARRFVWSGTLEARVSLAPPYDVPNSTVRVIVADQAGTLLVDELIKGGAGWKKDPKGGWTYTNSDPGARVSRATFRDPDAKRFGRSFEIEGVTLANIRTGARAPRLAGGLVVDWTGDISGPCGVVAVPVCGPREIMGEQWMVCRERALR